MTSEPVTAASFVSVLISPCVLGRLALVSVEFNFAFVRILQSGRKARPLLRRLRFLPSRMGCNSEERVVMGDFAQVSRAMRESWNAASIS